MISQSLVIDDPWCVRGDFNVISDTADKLGGKPHIMYTSLNNFICCIKSCGLFDVGFSGSKYTWCNNRRPGKRIWKRLDRIFLNDYWIQALDNNMVRHLTRTGSDHRPLLLKSHNNQQSFIKYFQFLIFLDNSA